ncbi:hypothetical protein NBO_10g0009 [Nosema bombycis CQ1]|jgi:hypothetical protein|uniref:Uncharacterized protein n=1 Tax=Nosema bombycis (strain CQ1 / CVCC 102059) TaxID=578461 RepID=R0MQ70_NOSB1|nr:hypothetical protein NBO_10g0009 [Nosema bombycis CQ1]|eukprot:EOB15018.1 hypothetical protein NBO_10g0009 [Nosema bombycis CQ1]
MDDNGSLDDKNEKYAGSTYPVPPKAGELPTLEKKEKSKLTKKEKKNYGRKLIIDFYGKK